jgi:hypothetical protein
MLKEKDKIFKNIYGYDDWGIKDLENVEYGLILKI